MARETLTNTQLPSSPNYLSLSLSPQSYFGFQVWASYTDRIQTAPPLPSVPKHPIRRLIPLTAVVGSLAQFYCFFCSRLCVKVEGCFLSATCAVWTSGACTVSIIYPKPCSPPTPLSFRESTYQSVFGKNLTPQA